MDLLGVLIVVLLVLWLGGVVAFPTIGGSAIHVLLVIVLVLVILRLLRGQKV